jgi:uncharacterized BrkB/YihY/UPF0761 family membrane protein
MIYIKSVLVGILTLILTVFSLVLCLLIYSATSSNPDFAIGWDPRGAKSPLFWIVVMLIVAVGYIWEYRRLSKRISN